MVKLNWLEEFAVYIIVAVFMVVFVRFIQNLIGFTYYSTWVWIVLWFILYLGISSIVVKAIKGKDNPKLKKSRTFKEWWKGQSSRDKVLLILLWIFILLIILTLL